MMRPPVGLLAMGALMAQQESLRDALGTLRGRPVEAPKCHVRTRRQEKIHKNRSRMAKASRRRNRR